MLPFTLAAMLAAVGPAKAEHYRNEAVVVAQRQISDVPDAALVSPETIVELDQQLYEMAVRRACDEDRSACQGPGGDDAVRGMIRGKAVQVGDGSLRTLPHVRRPLRRRRPRRNHAPEVGSEHPTKLRT
jgi:hypothetical protein